MNTAWKAAAAASVCAAGTAWAERGAAALTYSSAAGAISMPEDAKKELPTTEGFSDFWNGWKRNVELGFNGAEGNSDNFSIRGGIGAKREAKDMVTTAGLSYKYAQQDDEKSQSRGEAFAKTDYVFDESKWGFFWQAKLEYDEFQAWDWRASIFLGPSYTFIKDDRTLLRGRAGIGGSYEFGGEGDEEFHPEAMLGVDWEHRLTERQKLFLTVEWYPSLDEFPDYRAYARGGWEIMVDPEANMFLKLGFEDRYDISPGDGRKKNDFEYYGMISWVF